MVFDDSTLLFELSSRANPSPPTRMRVAFTRTDATRSAGTVEATPEVLAEHQRYVEVHRIELVVYRLEYDNAGRASADGIAKFSDPVAAIEFAQEADHKIFVTAEGHGPYWRSNDPEHVMPWALTSYSDFKHAEAERFAQAIYGTDAD